MVRTINDLIEVYKHIAQMIESYNKSYKIDVKPWDCVKHLNKNPFENNPIFIDKPWDYEFAIKILFNTDSGEHAPNFEGNAIYSKSGSMLNWKDPSHRNQLLVFPYAWTLTKPQLNLE